MTEDDARAWIEGRWGGAAVAVLDRFVTMVRDEATRQNLVAPSTLDTIWVRHVVDSAQLLLWGSDRFGSWVDIGTGAGFPGVVVAILRQAPIIFVEPRVRRAEFLRAIADALDMRWVAVAQTKVESLPSMHAEVISARAVSHTMALLGATTHLRSPATTLLFPRGRTGADELANLPPEWQAMFHVEHSLTDPESVVLVANGGT